MNIYKELDELGLFKWLNSKHHINESDLTPEYLSTINKTDIHITVTHACAFRFLLSKYGYYPLNEWNPQFRKWIARYCNIDGSMGAISAHENPIDAEIASLERMIELIKDKK